MLFDNFFRFELRILIYIIFNVKVSFKDLYVDIIYDYILILFFYLKIFLSFVKVLIIRLFKISGSIIFLEVYYE